MRRGRETVMCERNIDWVLLTWAPTGDQPVTQAHALTGNRTGKLLRCGTVPNKLSHTGWGDHQFLNALLKKKKKNKKKRKIIYDLENMLVNFSLHYFFQKMGSKGASRVFNYVLEHVGIPPPLRCTIFYLGLFFKCIEVWLNIFGYCHYVKKRPHLVKYSFITFAVSQLWAARRLWGYEIRHWTEGGWVGGGHLGETWDWGALLPPPTVVEKMIGSSWFPSNSFGWVISGEGGKVMVLDLSLPEH